MFEKKKQYFLSDTSILEDSTEEMFSILELQLEPLFVKKKGIVALSSKLCFDST